MKIKVNLTSELSDSKYYGFQRRVGEKGFITREDWHNGKFIPNACDGFTHGNGYSNHRNHTNLKDLITNLINSEFTVFEFKSNKSLFNWLVK